MADAVVVSDQAFPRLSAQFLDLLDAAGRRRPLEAGAALYRAGEVNTELYVILHGRVALMDALGSSAERVIGFVEAHRFTGELSLMTGQPAYLTPVVSEAGEAIVLTVDELQGVIGSNQALGDVILRAFLARRAELIGLGSGMRLVGSRLDPNSRRLREFLTRNRIPHAFLDLESDTDAEQLLRALSVTPAETPLLLSGPLAMRNPTNREVAAALNLRTVSRDEVCDTVVVGAGPAGLGAAVYAASEGLTTVLVDSVALGGQASTSVADRELPRLPGRDLGLRARRAGVAAGHPVRRAHRRARACRAL